MIRVISLGFDGVLHPARVGPGGTKHFQWLAHLAEMLLPWPDVHLAIHSDWRYQYTGEELRQLLGPLGTRVIGVSPRGPREQSVLWLLHLLGDVDSLLVLDARANEFSEIESSTLVVCDPFTGVSAQAVQSRIKAWLARETCSAAVADVQA